MSINALYVEPEVLDADAVGVDPQLDEGVERDLEVG